MKKNPVRNSLNNLKVLRWNEYKKLLERDPGNWTDEQIDEWWGKVKHLPYNPYREGL